MGDGLVVGGRDGVYRVPRILRRLDLDVERTPVVFVVIYCILFRAGHY